MNNIKPNLNEAQISENKNENLNNNKSIKPLTFNKKGKEKDDESDISINKESQNAGQINNNLQNDAKAIEQESKEGLETITENVKAEDLKSHNN